MSEKFGHSPAFFIALRDKYIFEIRAAATKRGIDIEAKKSARSASRLPAVVLNTAVNRTKALRGKPDTVVVAGDRCWRTYWSTAW